MKKPRRRTAGESRVTRVLPVFEWLKHNGGADWTQRLVNLADGLQTRIETGAVRSLRVRLEERVAPSSERLRWMLENAERLVPREGRRFREFQQRVLQHPARQATVERLAAVGSLKGIDRKLILEGKTSADCLITCRNALVWIEGKRNDWLAPATTWDSARDQLARNLEAARSVAREQGKSAYCVIVCYEARLKFHEEALIDGYRAGTWSAGLLHLGADVRRELGSRLGTLRWSSIADQWPQLRTLRELQDLQR